MYSLRSPAQPLVIFLPHSTLTVTSAHCLWVTWKDWMGHTVGQCGSVWVSVGQCGSVRVSVGQCGSVGVSVGQCGSVWVSEGQCGSVWVSGGQCGSVWVSVGQCGSVRVSVGQWDRVTTCNESVKVSTLFVTLTMGSSVALSSVQHYSRVLLFQVPTFKNRILPNPVIQRSNVIDNLFPSLNIGVFRRSQDSLSHKIGLSSNPLLQYLFGSYPVHHSFSNLKIGFSPNYAT